MNDSSRKLETDCARRSWWCSENAPHPGGGNGNRNGVGNGGGKCSC